MITVINFASMFLMGFWASWMLMRGTYHSAHRELARTRDQMLDGCRRLKGELEEYKVKSDVWYDQAVARLLQIAKEAEPAVSDQMMAELNQILIEGGMMKSSRPNLTLVYSKEKDT